MASKLKNRRNFLTGLTIQTPCASTETECHELHANYIVGDEIIGQGTTAVVKSGMQRQSGLPVAIKEIKMYGDEELCEVVRKEFQIMKSLNHPNIVKVHDLYFSPSMTKAYLCMDLVRGGTLQGAVEMHGKISEAIMRPLFEQLASALSYLHCKRITHRDLKPDNLLVSESLDKLYICDFNYARKLADGAALTNRVGAMAFASPEMLLGTGILGEQMDIWSVGVCLYFALSGGCTLTQRKGFSDQKPFGEYLAHATATERQEWIRIIGLSKESLVAQVLWACLNPDPSQRPDAMLLLAHPWVSPTDMDEDPTPIRRTPSGACHLTPPSRKSCSMSSRSQRLCAHGFGAGEQLFSDRSDVSTIASSADASPYLPLNAMWNTVPCQDDEDADSVFTHTRSFLRQATID
jgi:serine/threonine protein kinase